MRRLSFQPLSSPFLQTQVSKISLRSQAWNGQKPTEISVKGQEEQTAIVLVPETNPTPH